MARGPDDLMGKTRALVIVHEGRLVFERYADGFGPETKQVSWSMAKSITSALVGRAVALGLIENIDAPMPSPFEEGDPRSEVTWRQWLTMTDGLDYAEIGAADLATNDVVQMMYGPGRFDVTQYIVSELEPAHEPGTHWNYSTAGFHLLGWALERVVVQDAELGMPPRICTGTPPILGTDEYYAELQDACHPMAARIAYANWSLENSKKRAEGRGHSVPFNGFIIPQLRLIGMDAQPEFDAAGTFLGGSLVWASARDFAKFGYLYLRDGVWDGERLLPEGWVDFSRTGPTTDDGNIYGAGFWLTADGDSSAGDYHQGDPGDAFSAEGHEGQMIYIVPSRDLVIVRLGLMPNGGDNWPALFEWNQSLANLFPETRFASNSDESDEG